ncbi:MAG: hypothetical protein HQL66_11265 [Magnetococcales bacterium]|nr:hypothetical protein [Magnetococcales bacterium]
MFDNLVAGQPESVAWLLLLFGAFLTVVGILKIIGNGIPLLIWIFLVIVGTSAVDLGLRHQKSVQFTQEVQTKLGSIVGPGKTLSQEAVRALCESYGKPGGVSKGTEPPPANLPTTTRQ